MDVYAHRMKNLRALVAERTAAAVASESGTSAVYLSQILTGVKDRKGKPRQVGASLARKLEIGAGKAPGWMDNDHDIQATQARHSSPTTAPKKADITNRSYFMPLTKKQQELRDTIIICAPMITDAQAEAIKSMILASVPAPPEGMSSLHFDVVERIAAPKPRAKRVTK